MEKNTSALISIAWFAAALLLPSPLYPQEEKEKYLPENARIFVISQRTDAKTQASRADPRNKFKLEEIPFVIRMPSSWTKEKDETAAKSKKPCVRGAIAICTWDKTLDYLKKNLSYFDSQHKFLIKFADENDIAVMTWANFGGYSTSTSSDEMTERQLKSYDAIFNDRLSEWEKGFRRILNKYNLPKNAIMLYGFSGGAQIAHRIAFRRPQYFSGIHIHVNSSYDIPTPNAKNIMWLVTTGELEYGYPAATRFYQKMIDMGYCVIFKAAENLGHSINYNIQKLSIEFFKYMINFVPDQSNPDWKAPPIDKFYLMRHPIYIGDYLNQVAYPTDMALKRVADRKYMVALPTKPIAKAWGTIIEK